MKTDKEIIPGLTTVLYAFGESIELVKHAHSDRASILVDFFQEGIRCLNDWYLFVYLS